MAEMREPVRCWPTTDPLYIAYHDDEWGRPVRDEHRLLERISLEAFQSGLAWITILRKRENFRAAFARFDPAVIARYGDADVERLMADAGIVRNRAKIEATIANARATLALHEAGETLDALLWSFAPAAPAPPPRVARRDARHHAGVQGARARAQAPRLSLRRPDDRLRAHAGDRDRQRPRRGAATSARPSRPSGPPPRDGADQRRWRRSPRIVAMNVLAFSSRRCGSEAAGFTAPNGSITSRCDCDGTGGSPATKLV